MFIRSALLALSMASSAAAFAVDYAPSIGQKPVAPPKALSPPAANAPMTRAIFTQGLDAQFKSIDADGNGTITRKELDAAQQRLNSQVKSTTAKKAEARFRELDSNKDGQLSLSEFSAPLDQRKIVPDGEAAMTRLDTNKDGKITPAEYRAQALSNFDRVDANHDGTLSDAERKVRRAH